MKRFITLLLVHAVCIGSFASNVIFEQLGQVFDQTNLNVEWMVPPKSLPHGLWVYRSEPADFPPTIISNLMALGGFTDADKTKNVPTGILSFASADKKRTLRIYPEHGYIDYNDYAANDMNVTNGVPDEKQAFVLATNYLPLLNIAPASLAKKANGDLRTYNVDETAILYKGRGMPAYATNTHIRGIDFIRSVDGVDFIGSGGRGGCQIEFGHQAKVSRMLLSWRKLERNGFYPAAKTKTFLTWFREGKAVYEPPQDYDIDWPSVKKITITKVTPQYFGEVYSEPQNIVSPIASLEATVDTGQTNLTVSFYCPIIDESKPRN